MAFPPASKFLQHFFQLQGFADHEQAVALVDPYPGTGVKICGNQVLEFEVHGIKLLLLSEFWMGRADWYQMPMFWIQDFQLKRIKLISVPVSIDPNNLPASEAPVKKWFLVSGGSFNNRDKSQLISSVTVNMYSVMANHFFQVKYLRENMCSK